MASKVTENGQITLDDLVREQLGIRPGMIADQHVVDGHLQIDFLPAPESRSHFGALHQEGGPKPLVTNAEIEQAVMEAVAEEMRLKKRGK